MLLSLFRALTTALLLLAAGGAVSAADGNVSADFLVRSWLSEDGLPGNNVRSLAQAVDGYLWVATAEGVVRFDGAEFGGFDHAEDERLARLAPRAVHALPDGDVWVITRRGGLLRWRDGRLRLMMPESEDEESLAGLIITEVLADTEGRVWLRSADELYQVKGDDGPHRVTETPEVRAQLKRARDHTRSRSVTGSVDGLLELTDQRGRVWSRTATGSLNVKLLGVGGTHELPEFATGNRVMALLEDREGHLWVATNGDGLRQIRERRVQMLGKIPPSMERHFLALLEDHSGCVWAGAKSGGVIRIRSGDVEHFSLGSRDQDRAVSALHEDARGGLWAVKNNGALFHFVDGGFHALNGESPVMRRVMAMTTDASGRLWLGSAGGLALWTDGRVQMQEVPGAPREQVSTLMAAADGRVWAGTSSGRLFHGDDHGFEEIITGSRSAISAILPESADSAWVATAGEGLLAIAKGRVSRFAKPHGLPDERLTCVLGDAGGYLWLGSLSGIFRVAKADLRAVMEGRAAKAGWVRLDRADGLLSRECVGSVQPAGWCGRDGSLLFPTVNGIAQVKPRGFEINPAPPLVCIHRVLVGGLKGELQDGAVSAGPGRSRLEFHFTALSFAAPEKVRFETRLTGLEPEWQDLGTRRFAAYEAVPPGKYVFEMRAANNDGVWSTDTVQLAVQVTPHFWQTLWFQGAVAVMIVGASFGIGLMISRARARGRLLRLEAQTARLHERERIAQDLHDDLGANLTEISLIAGLAAEDAAGAAQQERIPIIAVKARELVSTLDEIVWAVNPRHDTLASFVEYLTASAAELLEAGGIGLRQALPASLPDLALDAEQRHALYLAAREALNNAVKHSAATEARLGVEFTEAMLKVTVQDNGRGFRTESKNLSEGLRNMQARLAGIGGSCDISSEPSGTCVRFVLPLKPTASS